MEKREPDRHGRATMAGLADIGRTDLMMKPTVNMTGITPGGGSGSGCFGLCSSHNYESSASDSSSSLCSLGASSRRTSKRDFGRQQHHMVDTELAQEMNKMTVQERERVLADIHGVMEEPKEDPETLRELYKKVDEEIAMLAPNKRKDLDRALFLLKKSTFEDSFKLMFLRTDEYKPRLAAKRMALHFSTKRDLFGADKLVNDIVLDDLQEQDMKFLKSGTSFLASLYRDRSGRPIWFEGSSKESIRNADSTGRVNWYRIMAVLEDEAVQKKGIVALLHSPDDEYAPTPPPKDDGTDEDTPPSIPMSELIKSFQKSQLVVDSLPVRMTSIHYCYDNPLTHFFLKTVQVFQPNDYKFRIRTHFGTSTELKYSLLPFGVASAGIIIGGDDEKDWKPDMIEEYLRQRRQMEQEHIQNRLDVEAQTGTIAFPRKNDVVMGRGRPYREFTPTRNLYFFELIDQNRQEYKDCKHLFEKTVIIKNVIKKIQESGGRFLIRNNKEEGAWVVAEEDAIVSRIRKAFRTATPKPPAKDGQDTGSNSNPEPDRSAKRLKT